MGEIMNWGKMRQGGPSLDAFKGSVTFANIKLRERAELAGCCVWKHERLNKTRLLLRDGVHLNDKGMARYWRSVHGALVMSLKHDQQ